jgi:uncharacterized protein (TIGR03086 family)
VNDFASAEEGLVAVQYVVETIRADDLHRPTPCDEWDLQALAEHLIDTISRLGTAAGIHVPAPGTASIDQRITQVTQPILAQWRRRGLTGDVMFSGRTLPSHLALGILSLELVVHGWDFAITLNRPLPVSDAHAAHVLGLARQTLTTESRATAGFDPPVTTPDHAGALERLIAFAGRDPLRVNYTGGS